MGGLPGRGTSTGKAQVGQSVGDGGTEGRARAGAWSTRGWIMRPEAGMGQVLQAWMAVPRCWGRGVARDI